MITYISQAGYWQLKRVYVHVVYIIIIYIDVHVAIALAARTRIMSIHTCSS